MQPRAGVDVRARAMTIIVRTVQHEMFKDEPPDKSEGESAKKQQSRFYRLDPFVDRDGVLRVGGRLRIW